MTTQTAGSEAHAHAGDHLVHEVVGAPLSPFEASVAVGAGVTALVMAGAMPILLGALANLHRLPVAQIGDTAMAESLTMGLTTAGFSAFVKPARLRLIGFTSIAAVAAINLAMILASGWAVVGLRAFAGIFEGVLIWLTTGMIARSETPERWAGVFFTVLTACQFALTVVLTTLVEPRFGPEGGFVLGAILIGLAAPLAFLGRDRYAALPGGGTTPGSPPPRGWVALAGMFLYIAAFAAVAIYTVPLARQAHLDERVADIAVTASLAVQILGSATATVLAGRIHYFAVVIFAVLCSLAAWATFLFWPPAWLFIVASMALGFVYMVAAPFLVPMVIEADPSRRAAVQAGGAQLFGGALGPFLASRMVGEHDVHGAVILGACLLTGALAIFGGLHLTSRAGILAAAGADQGAST
jgi:MFS family permease